MPCFQMRKISVPGKFNAAVIQRMPVTEKHQKYNQRMPSCQNGHHAPWNLYFTDLHDKQKLAQRNIRLSKIRKLHRYQGFLHRRGIQLQQKAHKINAQRNNQHEQCLLLPGRFLSGYIKCFQHQNHNSKILDHQKNCMHPFLLLKIMLCHLFKFADRHRLCIIISLNHVAALLF